MKKTLLLTLSLFLVSCATNMVDKAGVNKIKSSKGVFLTLGPEDAVTGKYYKVGSQGLLDILLTSGGGKDIKAVMDTLNAVELSNKELVPSLKNHLDSITITKQYIDSNSLNKRKDKESGEYKFDLSKYVLGYNYAVILKINRFGAARPFFSVVPTGAPLGNAFLELQVIDLATYKILAEVNATADVPVNGTWRQEPEYTNLKESSVKAFHLATKKLVGKVFE